MLLWDSLQKLSRVRVSLFFFGMKEDEFWIIRTLARRRTMIAEIMMILKNLFAQEVCADNEKDEI